MVNNTSKIYILKLPSTHWGFFLGHHTGSFSVPLSPADNSTCPHCAGAPVAYISLPAASQALRWEELSLALGVPLDDVAVFLTETDSSLPLSYQLQFQILTAKASLHSSVPRTLTEPAELVTLPEGPRARSDSSGEEQTAGRLYRHRQCVGICAVLRKLKSIPGL